MKLTKQQCAEMKELTERLYATRDALRAGIEAFNEKVRRAYYDAVINQRDAYNDVVREATEWANSIGESGREVVDAT